MGLWSGIVEIVKMIGFCVYYFGSDFFVVFVVVGYIVGFNIVFLVFFGGVIVWFIVIFFYVG